MVSPYELGCRADGEPLSKPIVRLRHPHYPLIQGRLLVMFLSFRRLDLCLRYVIRLFIGSRHPGILLRRSLVILGAAFSTDLKTVKRLVKAGAKESEYSTTWGEECQGSVESGKSGWEDSGPRSTQSGQGRDIAERRK